MPTLSYQLSGYPITPGDFKLRCDRYSRFQNHMHALVFSFPSLCLLIPASASVLTPFLPNIRSSNSAFIAWLVALALSLIIASKLLRNLKTFKRRYGLLCPSCHQALFHRRSLLLPSGHCPHCSHPIIHTPPISPPLSPPTSPPTSPTTPLPTPSTPSPP